MGLGDGGNVVGEAAWLRQADLHFAGQAGGRSRHEAGFHLASRGNDVDSVILATDERRIDKAATEGEDAVDPLGLERAGQHVATGDLSLRCLTDIVHNASPMF